MSPHRLLSDRGRCPCQTRESKGEQKVQSILKKYNINFISQYRIESYKRAPFDFCLPDFNILIEYQGEQHFRPVNFFGGEAQFKKQITVDKRKKEEAEKLGYKIIYINYDEYSILEETLVQRLIVSSSELKRQISEMSDNDIV